MRVTMDFLGERQVQRRLEGFEVYAADASPAFEAIYDYLLRVEEMQFGSEGSASGHPWAPLAESTVIAKARAKLRPEILRATDALLKSLTVKDDSNQLHEVTDSSLAFGSNLPYGAMHQVPGPMAPYPQRRPIDLTEANKRAIIKTLQLWLARGIVRVP